MMLQNHRPTHVIFAALALLTPALVMAADLSEDQAESLMLGDRNELPALFHCATGKDRTGWAAAALLSLLGVPRDVAMEDYLRSNDYIIPFYRGAIDKFVAAGGDKEIPLILLGVKRSFLEAAFDEMETKYGSIEKYFSEGLGIDPEQQQALRKLYLGGPS